MMGGSLLIYLSIAVILAGFALIWAFHPTWGSSIGAAGAALLAIFAGVRYQTGYDWPTYELIFSALSGAVNERAGLPEIPPVEPLYAAVNQAVYFAGGNLSWIFLIAAIFNMAVLWWVASRISSASPFMWLIYFGVTFLSAQMAMERQAIASSFVLLSLLVVTQKRWLLGLGLIFVGMGFHSSVALFLPILVLAFWRPAWWATVALLAPGLFILVFGIDVFRTALAIAPVFGDNWMAAKLAVYARVEAARVSLSAIGLAALHVAVLAVIYRFSNLEERKDRTVTVAIWLTVWMLGAHLYFWSLPSFWNRIMLVAVPWQVVTLFRLKALHLMPTFWRVVAVLAFSAFSIGSLVYFLIKPEARPYIPYNSTIAVALSGNVGDGRERAREALEAYNEANPGISAVPPSK